MNDSIARMIRTAAQAVVGVGALGIAQWIAVDIPDRYDRYAYPAAFVIVAVAQNLIESATGKGLLRPSSPPAPTTVEAVAKVP